LFETIKFPFNARTVAPKRHLKHNLLAKMQSRSDVATYRLAPIRSNKEIKMKMKLALIGAVAVAAAAFATPVLAQAGAGSYRDWQNGNAMMSQYAAESGAYRYHGGPKSND
jgi:hypothetical protein